MDEQQMNNNMEINNEMRDLFCQWHAILKH